jgi:hypothetical protein
MWWSALLIHSETSFNSSVAYGCDYTSSTNHLGRSEDHSPGFFCSFGFRLPMKLIPDHAEKPGDRCHHHSEMYAGQGDVEEVDIMGSGRRRQRCIYCIYQAMHLVLKDLMSGSSTGVGGKSPRLQACSNLVCLIRPVHLSFELLLSGASCLTYCH